MSDELTADEAHELLVEAQLQAKLKADLHARAFDVLRELVPKLEYLSSKMQSFEDGHVMPNPVAFATALDIALRDTGARLLIQEAGE